MFCEEQGVAFEADRDGRDGEAVHLVAVAGERVIGTCRLLPAGADGAPGPHGREGRAARRRRGHPAARSRRSRVRGAGPRPGGAARAGRRPRRVRPRGLRPAGEPFVEQGIEHVTMEKALA
ncbi:MAG: hypothetical protein WKF40_11795 [Thermoleophilaceae bacterium]